MNWQICIHLYTNNTRSFKKNNQKFVVNQNKMTAIQRFQTLAAQTSTNSVIRMFN